ncbi:hypothetical protein NEOKW01_0721 [Nematocida sp. AWRm80]|nr:hypothetical protein NEOKW01_0721 [Nematocida sp. AWRm80]
MDKETVRSQSNNQLLSRIANDKVLEDRVLAAYLYYKDKKDYNNTKITDREEYKGLEYILHCRGKVSNGIVEVDINRLLEETNNLNTTHELRIGLETLQILLKYLRTNQESTKGIIDSINRSKDNIIRVLEDKLSVSHYVIRIIIREIVKEMVYLLGESVIRSSIWSENNRLDIQLEIEENTKEITEEEIELLNDKMKGSTMVKILNRTDSSAYSHLLSKVQSNSTGSRNIKQLITKMTERTKENILNKLLKEKSLNAIYFISALDTTKEIERYCTTANEEIRIEYLEALVQRTEFTKDTPELVLQWMKYNQIILTKEGQKRTRIFIRAFLKKIKNKYLRRCIYLHTQNIEEEECTKIEGIFKQIVKIAIEMSQSTNYCRQLQGLHYLYSISQIPECNTFLSEDTKKNIIFSTLTTTHKEIREISSLFPVDITLKEIKEAFTQHNSSMLNGVVLLLQQEIIRAIAREENINGMKEKINEIITFVLSYLDQNINTTLVYTYRAIHVLWSIFNVSTGYILILDQNRLNPEVLVANQKRRTKNIPPIDLLSTGILIPSERINKIYYDVIENMFNRSVKVLENKEIYCSIDRNITGIDLLDKEEEIDLLEREEKEERTKHYFILHWYILRECCMYQCIRGIITREVSVIDTLLETLFRLGGHLGAIMVIPQCIKILLIHNDSSEQRLALAKEAFRKIEANNFKTVRRDGGIPCAFKAISGSEQNIKDKQSTHYIMRTAIQNAFRQIDSITDRKEVETEEQSKSKEEKEIERTMSIIQTIAFGKENKEERVKSLRSLIHYINIVKGVAGDTVFRYDVRIYEPALFQLATSLLAHADWTVQNAALMLYSTLIKKMCKETVNELVLEEKKACYTKTTINKDSRQVVLRSLKVYDSQRNVTGVFCCLVFFSRVPSLLKTEEEWLLQMNRSKYPQRIKDKIDSILNRIPADYSEEILIDNEHDKIPEEIVSALRIAQTNHSECIPSEHKGISEDNHLTDIDNNKDLNKTEHKTEAICKSAVEIEALLEAISNENPQIREYALSALKVSHSYEYTMRQLLKKTSCKECLRKLLHRRRSQGPILEETEIFPQEHANPFRDISYELSILDNCIISASNQSTNHR